MMRWYLFEQTGKSDLVGYHCIVGIQQIPGPTVALLCTMVYSFLFDDLALMLHFRLIMSSLNGRMALTPGVTSTSACLPSSSLIPLFFSLTNFNQDILSTLLALTSSRLWPLPTGKKCLVLSSRMLCMSLFLLLFLMLISSKSSKQQGMATAEGVG